MSLTAREKGNVEPTPAGVYVGIAYGIIDLGTQDNPTFKKQEHKVLIQWELPSCRSEFERDGEMIDLPRVISKRYTLSLSEKANLRKDLESWRGRKFTADELKGFDLKAILGKPCQINVVHETGKDGRVFASIAAIMSIPKGTPTPDKPENPVTFFSWEEAPAGELPEIPDMPEWVSKIIQQSHEWQERIGGNTATSAPPPADQPGSNFEPEDNIPF